ncbi:PAS domain-containing hybrid sensor histidine kinase/response regulator [Alteromonas sp. CYL-A6]|uniref:PAS domain-containing hybrid sensor histidine kinase/response regulator n=1 Tax=Alteromonas nitratireducens TaxID=3390813 RepID=UPI0034C24FA4
MHSSPDVTSAFEINSVGAIIANASSVMIWVSNDVKECIYFNKAWLDYRGRTLVQEYGYGWAEGVHKDDFQLCLDIYNQAFDARQPFSMDYRLLDSEGQYGWIRDDGTPYYDDNGQFLGFVGSCFDVTESKHLVERLQAKKEALIDANLQMSELIKAGNIGFWDWHLVTNTVHFSKEYKQQLGYEADEMTDEYVEWESRLHPDDREETLATIKHSIATLSQNHETLFRLKNKQGEYRWILCHASVMGDENGHPVRMIGSHIDVTERREMETALRHSQKMDAIGHLAGGVAHDFNNHLASILGFAELINSTDDITKVKRYCEKIIAAAENSKSLTKQLVAFSRKQSIDAEPVDIHEQITDAVDMLSRTLDKRITIHADLQAPSAVIQADKASIPNVLLNLGLNARDAMPEGGEIHISTAGKVISADSFPAKHGTLQPGSYVQISVRDTGCGIPTEHLRRIFEPYFTTKEEDKGTGLGLASVYRAIEQLDGTISVDSEPGRGTCFTILLPVVDSAHVKPDSVERVATKVETKPVILVVDDEALLREICGEFINNLGYQGVFAGEGDEAVNLYRQHQQDIDVVILDMMMPGMTGEQTLTQLLAINPDVKVIISSGSLLGEQTERLLLHGAQAVLQKPFRFEEFDAAIKSCL